MNCPLCTSRAPIRIVLAGILWVSVLLVTGCGGSDLPDEDVQNIDASETTDPCAGIANRCEDVGATCDGDTTVLCAEDGNGCLVESRTDCTLLGETCQASTGRCAEDVCASVSNPCSAVDRRCEGDILQVCAADNRGCLQETTTDCAAMGTTCDDSTGSAVCVGGMCQNEAECDPGSRRCDGQDLVICDIDQQGCLFEQTVPCRDPLTCGEVDGNFICYEPCSDDPACEGSSSGDAVCVADTIETCVDVDGCMEQIVTDCGAGTCDDTSGAPVCTVAGELVVGVNTVFETAPEFFTAIHDGDDIPVTAGFQGTWMVVVAIKTRALFAGNITVGAQIELDGQSMGMISLENQMLTDGGDGYDYYYNLFVDMGIFEPPAMGTPIAVTITVEDALGAMVEETRSGFVGEALVP